MHETTALGAAIAAGMAIGVWGELSELEAVNRDHHKAFYPQKTAKESAIMYRRWTKAVEMSRGWLDENDEPIPDPTEAS